MYRNSLIMLLLICIFTTGCWDQVDLNNTAVCSGIGVDLTESDKIHFVAQFNKPINRQENTSSGESEFEVLSGVGESIAEAARKITLSLPRVPLWSHGETFIIGEKLATKDLSVLLDFLYRNRKIRMSSFVFITQDASLEEVYNANCPLALCSARGILKIVRWQEQQLGMYRPMLLNEFIVRAATPGIDPYAPLIDVIEDLEGQKILTVNEIAIFRDKKMVGKLNPQECRGLFWLQDRKPGGLLVVTYPDSLQVKINLETKDFKTKVFPHIENDKVTMFIRSEVEFNLLEVAGRLDERSTEFIKKVEKAAEEEIASQIRAAVVKGQKTKSDFLGFGRTIYRYEPDYWDRRKADWPDLYPQIALDIDIKVKLANSYLINNEFLATHKELKP